MQGIMERSERIACLTPEYRCAAPPPPRAVEIEMRAGEQSEMDPAFYRRIVREVRELGVDELGASCEGGPSGCRWLPEAIRYAKQDCEYPFVGLATDGRMAGAPCARACMEAGLDSLEFRITQGGQDELHEVTGARASDFKQVLENLKGARRVRDEVAAATGHRCGLFARLPAQDGIEDAVRPWVDEHYWRPCAGAALPCASLFTEGHITCDGRLSACVAVRDRRFDMGNLVHHGFMRAWHSQAFQRLRRAHLAGELAGTPCEGCGLVRPPAPAGGAS